MEEKIEIVNGNNFFDREMNSSVYWEKDACDYVRSTQKAGDIEKLFKIPEDIYSREHEDVGVTILKIFRCW